MEEKTKELEDELLLQKEKSHASSSGGSSGSSSSGTNTVAAGAASATSISSAAISNSSGIPDTNPFASSNNNDSNDIRSGDGEKGGNQRDLLSRIVTLESQAHSNSQKFMDKEAELETLQEMICISKESWAAANVQLCDEKEEVERELVDTKLRLVEVMASHQEMSAGGDRHCTPSKFQVQVQGRGNNKNKENQNQQEGSFVASTQKKHKNKAANENAQQCNTKESIKEPLGPSQTWMQMGATAVSNMRRSSLKSTSAARQGPPTGYT